MRKLILLAMTCLLTSVIASAQEEEQVTEDRAEILDKLVFGGNIGGGFSNGWSINLSPTVGYKITNTTIAGVGMSYIYRDFNSDFYANRSVFYVTGGRVFAQQLLFNNIYARGEYEYLDYSLRLYSNDGRLINESRGQAPGLLLGGGYTTSFGYGLGFNMEVLYNVIYRADISPYPSPLVIRGGFMFGF
jgi:hypothetical protein